MTQDQPGRAQDTGSVVRGEVVPDNETEVTQDEQSGSMTRFQKVASALRGDRPGQTAADPADPMSGPGSDEEYAHATRSDDMSAVRSPDTGNGAYRDDEQGADATIPHETPASGIASDPSMTGQTAAEDAYRSPVGTGAATTGGGLAGRHADAADAGLRPGEATDRLGDFGDIAFGNLLPDAQQYSAQWQQIQFRFVDDPQGSVTEAASVVSQVTTKLEAAIQERQRAIQERQLAIQERASALRGRWGEGSNADTETLRETLRMYRAFMDQLIGPAS
jgi:hypothetical protein